MCVCVCVLISRITVRMVLAEIEAEDEGGREGEVGGGEVNNGGEEKKETRYSTSLTITTSDIRHVTHTHYLFSTLTFFTSSLLCSPVLVWYEY